VAKAALSLSSRDRCPFHRYESPTITGLSSSFPKRMWFAFSRALISADRRDAVVFYERPCSARCGEAEWVSFHRETTLATWRVIKEAWNWIS